MQIRRRVSVLRENGTVLTPIAGAPHSDPFQVTTEKPTPAGWRPYLMGPHDPPRFSYDRRTGRSEIGQITVRIQDARVAGSNTQRWASAYVGDEDGWDQLHGLTLLREIQIDGGAWEPEFRGIITRVKAPDRTAVGSILELFAQDERILGRDRRIFATAPHASVDYARGASVLPLGVPYGVAQGGANSWQGWTASAPLQGKILGKGISLGALTLIGISDFRIPRTVENRMTDALARLADGRVHVAGMHATICPHARVWVRRLDTNAEGEFYLSVTANVNAGSTYDGEAQAPVYIHDGYVSRIGITPLRNTSHPKYMALPPAGTDVEFYVYNAGPPTEDAPFLTGWVHPATFIRDLLDGKFSLLNEEWGDDFPPERSDGSVALQPLEYVEAELAALEADASIGRMRFEIPRSYLLLEFLAEQLFRVRHIAGVVHADGKFHFSDLRLKPDTASGAVTLDPDLVIRAEWEAGEDMAPAIDVTTYTDWYGDPDVIPPGSKDDPIAKVKVTRHSSHPTPYRFVSEKLRRFADVNTITIDALGARGDQEASRIAEPYREIFGRGAAYARMTVQRGPSTQDLYPGDIRIVDTDAIPNFASNERGGLRLMQCVLAIPKWPELELRMLDLGPSTVALPPTITSVTQNATDPTSAIDVALTLNAAGEPVVLEVATTATSQGVVPDEDSDLWRPAGRYDSPGTITIGDLESGKRHWVRARTVAPRKLVSAWNSGLFADTAAAVSVLSLELAYEEDGSVTARWKVGPGTAGLRLYYQAHHPIVIGDPTLFVDVAASPAEHVFGSDVVVDGAFTVEAEAYPVFSGGAVSGTPGNRIADSVETPRPSTGIRWRGEHSSAPANPQVNDVYRNTNDGVVYIWTGTAWEILARDGAPGTGTGLEVRYSGPSAGQNISPTFNPALHAFMQIRRTDQSWPTDWVPIVGEDGTPGTDGVYYDYRFRVATTQPATPTGENPVGWSDAPPSYDPATGNKLWLSRALKNAADDSLLTTWSAPITLTGPSGQAGADGVTAVLSNDSHVIPTNPDGSGGNYTGAESTISVFQGAVDVSASWNYSASPSAGVTGSLVGRTYTVTAMSQDRGHVDITASRTGFPSLTVRFTLAKSKQGAAGTNATVYWLVTDVAAIKRDEAGAYTPASITVQGRSVTGNGTPAAYAGRFIIATFDGANWTNRYTSSSNESSHTYALPVGIMAVRVRLYQAGGTNNLLDEEVVPVVDDGDSTRAIRIRGLRWEQYAAGIDRQSLRVVMTVEKGSAVTGLRVRYISRQPILLPPNDELLVDEVVVPNANGEVILNAFFGASFIHGEYPFEVDVWPMIGAQQGVQKSAALPPYHESGDVGARVKINNTVYSGREMVLDPSTLAVDTLSDGTFRLRGTGAVSPHTHSIAEVSGLQAALDGKAAASHSHSISQISGLQAALDGKAAATHTHSISQVTGLQAALDGKANASTTWQRGTNGPVLGTFGGDLNDASGFHAFYGSTGATNRPPSGNSNVIGFGIANYTTQLAARSTWFYIRQQEAGVWGPWRQIAEQAWADGRFVALAGSYSNPSWLTALAASKLLPGVLGAGDYSLQATRRLYFDGGGDTYWQEVSANQLRAVVGGSERVRISTIGMTLAGDVAVGSLAATGAISRGGLNVPAIVAQATQPSTSLEPGTVWLELE